MFVRFNLVSSLRRFCISVMPWWRLSCVRTIPQCFHIMFWACLRICAADFFSSGDVLSFS